jgi:Flagellar hook-length control protein FliK
MTAPAAPPASGPIAAAAPRAPLQPPADRLAFAAVLDSLPGAATKAGPSAAEEQPHPSDEPRQEDSPLGQPAGYSPLSDGALLASLPFALRAASTMDEGPETADNARSLASAAMNGPGPKDNGASIAAGAKLVTAGRLIGERAFHFGVSAPAGAVASRTLAVDAPFAPAEAMPARPVADAAPFSNNASTSAPIAARPGGSATNRVSPARAAAHDAAQSGRKAEVAAPPQVARVADSAAAAASAESSRADKAPDRRPPDPIASAASPVAQADSFGAQFAPPLAGGAPFEPGASTARAADPGVAPRASVIAADPASAAPPVREIDVDLSPAGLENASMTMRLANDKLSVVIRAASSQTLSSIEGARDAIADRLAAIGQPLDSLIVKQAGVNTDGNANGNAASADDSSAGEKWRSAQDAGERSGSNSTSLSRRGAARDRSF